MDFRALFLENWIIKLLAFGLSLTLWFYVTSTGKTELTMTAPVELRNVPPGMTVVGDVIGNLQVRVQGQERLLRDGMLGKKIVALLDLSRSKEGENVLNISPYDIRHPSGTAITHVSLSEIKVKLEPLMRKAIKLKPILRGLPAAGYRLAGTTVTPTRITIEGPASVVKTLKNIETLPIDIRKASASVSVEARIDYRGQPVKLMEKNIVVRVNIERTRK